MMNNYNTRDRGTIYDDHLESLSGVKRNYQRFSLKKKEFDDNLEAIETYTAFKGGVPVLGDEGEENIYVDSQDSHTLVLGATGSKKTRIVVMPTVRVLGYSGESMVISDPKAEIYNRTAGELEEQGYHIVVLNFRNPALGESWNPLYIPYQFYMQGDVDKACEMVNDIANNFIASDSADKDPFWRDSAANLFFGLALILFKLGKETGEGEMMVNISNLYKLRRQLFDKDPSMTGIWRYVSDDEIIAPALSGTVLTAKDTRAGIISVFDQKIRHFVCQPSLLDMLSDNTIDFEQICERKTAVYLIMPDEKTTFHMMISLFVKQSYEYLINKAQNSLDGKMTVRLNYILDEFSSLPTIKDFPAMITAARSRNIRFCLIVQSKKQLVQRYSDEAETIQSNCTNWIFLTSREVPLLEEISTLCGRVNEGRLPLVSIFTLQHLDKSRGEALMLCGRLKPYFAFLMDIDLYDNKQYKIRNLECLERRERIDINCEEVIRGLLKEEGNFIKSLETMENIDSMEIKQLLGENYTRESMEYGQEVSKANIAYEQKDYRQAYYHYIRAFKLRKNNMFACDCENNLGYMLRRNEINEINIDGVKYDVPDILKKGIEQKKGFFLVNMALYASVMGKTVDMKRGETYIKQIRKEEGEIIKAWWERLALEGELEGFMVLYWLYQFGLISFSIICIREEAADILRKRFNVDPKQISTCKLRNSNFYMGV